MIKKKLKGHPLDEDEFFEIVKDVVDDRLTDIEKTYFVSACYNHELSIDETIYFTKAMVNTGDVLKFKGLVADKHCIGGVAGNRTTAFVVPIIAAAGYTMPKTSSRSITSPAGTADTIEVLANVSLSPNKIKEVVRETNACMVWGGGLSIVPSDSKLIRIEHSISLDPIGQMIASVLAKKIAMGATHCLIDIPVGKGAKVETRRKAIFLKKRFIKVANALNLKLKVLITDGSEPIGNGIGPALEARDLLWTLGNHPLASKQLRDKGVNLAGQLLKLLGEKHPFELANKLLEDGSALRKFNEILKAQGLIENQAKKIKLGKFVTGLKSDVSGKIKHIDNHFISTLAKIAGAPSDKGAGVYINFHKGRSISKGDVLLKIYSESKDKLNDAYKFASNHEIFIIK